MPASLCCTRTLAANRGAHYIGLEKLLQKARMHNQRDIVHVACHVKNDRPEAQKMMLEPPA